MESAGELVVDTALGHAIESGSHHLQRLFVACMSAVIDKQIENRRMRELRRRPEATVLGIKKFDRGLHHAIYKTARYFTRAPGERLGVIDSIHYVFGRLDYITVLLAIRRRQGEQYALESRAALVVLRRKVGSAKERTSIGS